MQQDIANGICLTEFKRSDADALVEFLGEEDIYDLTLRIPHPYTLADAEHWLKIVEKATRQNGQPVNWAIRHDGKVIGGIGFDGHVIGRSHRAEIGYWLAKPYWRRGIMTAAVEAVCQRAFENLGIIKIEAHTFAFNHGSQRVLEKCDFFPEGLNRMGLFFDISRLISERGISILAACGGISGEA